MSRPRDVNRGCNPAVSHLRSSSSALPEYGSSIVSDVRNVSQARSLNVRLTYF